MMTTLFDYKGFYKYTRSNIEKAVILEWISFTVGLWDAVTRL